MYQDPGWQRVLSMVPRVLIPGGIRRAASSDVATHPFTPIEVLRLVYLGFLSAFLLILIVLPFINPNASGSMTVATATVILIAAAAASYAAIMIFRDRGELVATPEEALDRFRTQMFVLIALAEAVAMIGFVLVFVTGSSTPYLVGLALAIPGLYMAAPNRASIERFQDRFGGAVDVLAALTRRPGWQ